MKGVVALIIILIVGLGVGFLATPQNYKVPELHKVWGVYPFINKYYIPGIAIDTNYLVWEDGKTYLYFDYVASTVMYIDDIQLHGASFYQVLEPVDGIPYYFAVYILSLNPNMIIYPGGGLAKIEVPVNILLAIPLVEENGEYYIKVKHPAYYMGPKQYNGIKGKMKVKDIELYEKPVYALLTEIKMKVNYWSDIENASIEYYFKTDDGDWYYLTNYHVDTAFASSLSKIDEVYKKEYQKYLDGLRRALELPKDMLETIRDSDSEWLYADAVDGVTIVEATQEYCIDPPVCAKTDTRFGINYDVAKQMLEEKGINVKIKAVYMMREIIGEGRVEGTNLKIIIYRPVLVIERVLIENGEITNKETTKIENPEGSTVDDDIDLNLLVAVGPEELIERVKNGETAIDYHPPMYAEYIMKPVTGDEQNIKLLLPPVMPEPEWEYPTQEPPPDWVRRVKDW